MKRPLLCITAFAFVLTGCAEFKESPPVRDVKNDVIIPVLTRSEGEFVSFDTLPNPYRLDVMQAVYDTYGDDIVLEPTDLYVRFLPQDSTQLELLEDICDLDLFDYPLERNVV